MVCFPFVTVRNLPDPDYGCTNDNKANGAPSSTASRTVKSADDHLASRKVVRNAKPKTQRSDQGLATDPLDTTLQATVVVRESRCFSQHLRDFVDWSIGFV